MSVRTRRATLAVLLPGLLAALSFVTADVASAQPCAAPSFWLSGIVDDPDFVVIGDFNGDGHDDAAVSEIDAETISVALGLGDGTFGPSRKLFFAEEPGGILAFDANEDGLTDLVVSTAPFSGPGELSILLSAGDGTFEPAQSFSLSSSTRSLTAGDFNGDGLVDMVNVQQTSVTFLMNSGTGTFTLETHPWVFATPNGVAAFDYNDDGIDDVAVTNSSDDSLSIVVASATGPPVPGSTILLPFEPEDMVSGDVDSDGRLDLAIALGNETTLFYRNTGASSLSLLQELSVGSAFLRDIRLADVDLDGNLDLISAYDGSPGVLIHHGSATGTFGAATPIADSFSVRDVGVGCFDATGGPDLMLVTSRSVDEVSVALNGPTGFDVIPGPPWVRTPAGLHPADFNGDGITDLFVASISPGVSVLLGTPDGQFTTPRITNLGIGNDPRPSDAFAHDWNGDGWLDLAVTLYLEDEVVILYGLGDGTFEVGEFIGTGKDPFAIDAADLDGDGDTDIVVVNADDDNATVLLANPDGTFGSPVQHPCGASPRDVTIVDLNLDGHLDLVVAALQLQSVGVLLGDGAGDFGPPTFTFLGPVDTARSGDLNADGRPDLVMTDSMDLITLVSTPSGSFIESRYTVPDSPYHLVILDFDHDGHLDVVSGSQWEDRSTLFLGDGTGALTVANTLDWSERSGDIAAVDVDLDGDLDLVAALRFVHAIGVIENYAANDCDANGIPDPCEIEADPSLDLNSNGTLDSCDTPPFIRRDCAADGQFNIADPIAALQGIFLGQPWACADACDVDDNGFVDLGDAITLLTTLFGGTVDPLGAGCSEDLTEDALDCDSYTCP